MKLKCVARCAFGAALLVPPLPLRGQAAPALRLTRDLRIDAGEQDLSAIGFIAVAPNGTIAVNQQQDGLIRFFDSRGKPLGTFGRKGQGPGEFETLGRTFWIADTLVAIDLIRRLTLVSPDRKLVRTVPFLPSVRTVTKPGAPAPNFNFPLPWARYANGDQLVFTHLAEGSPTPDWLAGAKSRSVIIRTDSAGVFEKLIAVQPEENCSVPFQGGKGSAAIPYCTTYRFAASPDGSTVAFVQVESSARPTYVLTMIRSEGDTAFRAQYLYQPIAIPKAAREEAIASVGRFGPDAMEALRKAKMPEHYPPVAMLLLSRDGTTWLELTTTTGPRRWHVIDLDGHVIGRVDLPRDVRLQVTSRHAVWGTQTDADGLQHIVRYTVSR